MIFEVILYKNDIKVVVKIAGLKEKEYLEFDSQIWSILPNCKNKKP